MVAMRQKILSVRSIQMSEKKGESSAFGDQCEVVQTADSILLARQKQQPLSFSQLTNRNINTKTHTHTTIDGSLANAAVIRLITVDRYSRRRKNDRQAFGYSAIHCSGA